VESLRFGRPCVTTSMGARGYHDLCSTGALIPTFSAAEMAQCIVALMRERSVTLQRGERGREVVMRQHSFSAFADIVRSGVYEAIASFQPNERSAGSCHVRQATNK
jgi:hypothetical protein